MLTEPMINIMAKMRKYKNRTKRFPSYNAYTRITSMPAESRECYESPVDDHPLTCHNNLNRGSETLMKCLQMMTTRCKDKKITEAFSIVIGNSLTSSTLALEANRRKSMILSLTSGFLGFEVDQKYSTITGMWPKRPT